MLLISGLISHASFRNIAEDILEVAKLHKVQALSSPEYLSGKTRNYTLRPLVIGSMISTEMHYYLALFYAHPTLRLAYLTAEGPLDKSWWSPNILSQYITVANSGWTARWLADAKIRVDAVVHHAYNPKVVAEAKKNPYTPAGPDGDTVWFSYIGQVGPRKRVEIALQSLRIAQRRTGYRVGLVTNAEITPLLQSDDRKIVKVGSFGSLPREMPLALIAGSQYYLHLSRSEGFGMPALEARALGKPLVAVDMMPTREFIPRGAALWVPVKETLQVESFGPMAFVEHVYDVEEAADIIVQAYDTYVNDRDAYQDMVERCLEGVEAYAHTNKYPTLLRMLGF